MLVVEIGFLFDLIVNGAGNKDTARIGKGLQTGCNVDAISVNIAAVDDDVADVDALCGTECGGPRARRSHTRPLLFAFQRRIERRPRRLRTRSAGHHPRIVDHISGDDSGKPALDGFIPHIPSETNLLGQFYMKLGGE